MTDDKPLIGSGTSPILYDVGQEQIQLAAYLLLNFPQCLTIAYKHKRNNLQQSQKGFGTLTCDLS